MVRVMVRFKLWVSLDLSYGFSFVRVIGLG